MRGSQYKYHAFISYSSKADLDFVPKIQQALGKILAPWHRLHSGPIKTFLDTREIGVVSDLTEEIKDGVRQSEYFILLASPEVTKSIWINFQEMEVYPEPYKTFLKPLEKVFIVVANGEVQGRDGSNEFDSKSTNVIPVSLQSELKAQPQWIDFRDLREGGIDCTRSYLKKGLPPTNKNKKCQRLR